MVVLIIAVVIVALVIGVFAMSAGTPKTSTSTLLTVNGKDFTVDDFYDYAYIKNEADGDISKEITSGDKETMLNDFMQKKIYLASAEKHAITVESEDIENFKTEYASKANTFASYGVTEEDYVSYKEEESKIDTLKSTFGEYYELPSNVYEQFVDSYSGDELKSYSYRMMVFYYDAPVENSGDTEESGEVTEETENAESGEVLPDRSKETILAKVENVHEQLLNGGDFGELAKENASYRITFKNNGYTFVNGDIEYAVYPVLESKVGNKDVFEALLKMNAGELTEIIEDPENNAFYLAKLESVEDGFIGEAETEVKEILLSEYQDTLIANENIYDVNMTALRLFYYEK